MENIKKILEDPMNEINLTIDEIKYVKGKQNQLKIILDSNSSINIDKIVEATNIINKILDENDFIAESYILDVSSKEKGVKKDE